MNICIVAGKQREDNLMSMQTAYNGIVCNQVYQAKVESKDNYVDCTRKQL